LTVSGATSRTHTQRGKEGEEEQEGKVQRIEEKESVRNDGTEKEIDQGDRSRR